MIKLCMCRERCIYNLKIYTLKRKTETKSNATEVPCVRKWMLSQCTDHSHQQALSLPFGQYRSGKMSYLRGTSVDVKRIAVN